MQQDYKDGYTVTVDGHLGGSLKISVDSLDSASVGIDDGITKLVMGKGKCLYEGGFGQMSDLMRLMGLRSGSKATKGEHIVELMIADDTEDMDLASLIVRNVREIMTMVKIREEFPIISDGDIPEELRDLLGDEVVDDTKDIIGGLLGFRPGEFKLFEPRLR